MASDKDAQYNPIVAMANKIRARRDVAAAVDGSVEPSDASSVLDAERALAAFADGLANGIRLLGSILGRRSITLVRLEKPLRVRVRFAEKRVALDLDAARELVVIAGDELDGEYQFDTGAAVPTLINLSKVSTESGYGEPLTPSTLLKHIARDAELPRPPHLGSGPLQF